MDINFLRSLVTVASLAAFLAIVWWAYGPSRKERFERDALLPFGDDEGSGVATFRGDFRSPSPLPPLPSGEGKWTAGNGPSAISRNDDGKRP